VVYNVQGGRVRGRNTLEKRKPAGKLPTQWLRNLEQTRLIWRKGLKGRIESGPDGARREKHRGDRLLRKRAAGPNKRGIGKVGQHVQRKGKRSDKKKKT